MKKSAWLVLASLFVSTSVFAQESKWYAGASAGQSDGGPYKFPSLTYTSIDEKDTSFKVFGGYKYNELLSVELSYNNLGKGTVAISDNGGISAESKMNATVLALKISPMASNVLSPFVKIGASHLRVEESNTVPENLKANATSFYYGIGAEYEISNNTAVVLEYESFGKAGSTDVNGTEAARVKPSSVSLGFKFSF